MFYGSVVKKSGESENFGCGCTYIGVPKSARSSPVRTDPNSATSQIQVMVSTERRKS
jgi:hypothetical protein